MDTSVKMKTMELCVSKREFHSILAAIRFWASKDAVPEDFHDIATCGGEVESLDSNEMTALGDRLNTTPAGEDRLIVRAPGGSKRREVPLKEVHVPDMWHLAMFLKSFAGKLTELKAQEEREDANPDGGDEALGQIAILEKLGVQARMPGLFEQASEDLLETWHLAHDLRRNLAGDV